MKKVLVAILVLTNLFLNSCKKDEELEEHNVWKKYSINEGLLNNNVVTVSKGNENDIYFGHDGGVSVFKDGKFISYPINSDVRVFSVLKRKNGELLAGLANGLFKLDGSSFVDQMKGNGSFLSLFEDSKGILWMGGSGGFLISGIEKYENSLFHKKDTTNNIWQFAEEKSGKVWVMGFGEAAAIFDFNSETYEFIDTVSKISTGQQWRVFVDSKDNVWFGINSSTGLVKYTRNTKNYDKLQIPSVRGIAEDKAGNIWVISNREPSPSLIKIDPSGTQTSFETGSSKPINALVIDNDGKIWLPSLGDGVYVYIP